MGAVILLILGAVAYFTLQTEAPTPEKPWRPYAQNEARSQPEWASSWGETYTTKAECQFIADKAVGRGYRQPAGCIYNGYQNAIVLSVVNSIIAPNAWKCVVRHTKREKYSDPVFELVLRGYADSEGDGWKCT